MLKISGEKPSPRVDVIMVPLNETQIVLIGGEAKTVFGDVHIFEPNRMTMSKYQLG